VKLIVLTGEWENVCVPLVEIERETETEPDADKDKEVVCVVLDVMESERIKDSVKDSDSLTDGL
jgi:hypothetical protein